MFSSSSRAAQWLAAIGLGLSTICAALAQQQPANDDAVIHTFPGDLVYPESVAVDSASGRFYVRAGNGDRGFFREWPPSRRWSTDWEDVRLRRYRRSAQALGLIS